MGKTCDKRHSIQPTSESHLPLIRQSLCERRMPSKVSEWTKISVLGKNFKSRAAPRRVEWGYLEWKALAESQVTREQLLLWEMGWRIPRKPASPQLCGGYQVACVFSFHRQKRGWGIVF
jgi:hypothetical protein